MSELIDQSVLDAAPVAPVVVTPETPATQPGRGGTLRDGLARIALAVTNNPGPAVNLGFA